MSPYEMAELAQSAFGNSLSAYGIFLSLVTAYLATAYLVGKKLTGTQVGILTALFVIVASLVGFSVAAYTNAGTEMIIRAFPESRGELLAPKPWLTPVIMMVNVFTVTVCLKFMWDVRHPKTSNRG